MKTAALKVTSTNAGDGGEAVEQNPKLQSVQPYAEPSGMEDAGWYVAVVRVNCEKRIKLAIEDVFRRKGYGLETWVPVGKRIVLNSRGKRNYREYVILSTFIFVKVEKAHLNEIRFRSDVYRLLSMPGTSVPYVIPDNILYNFRKIIEQDNAVVLDRPLRKGDRVRIIKGELTGCVAYVQRIQGKKAVIGNEIQYIGGATIEINKDSLEYMKE